MVAMKRNSGSRALRAVACAAVLPLMGMGVAGAAEAGAAASLRDRYAELKDQLGHTQFRRPLYMDSNESSNGVSGEIYALVDHSFATTDAALYMPSQWCDVLILHLNTKYCRPSTASLGTILQVNIGKKYDQPVDEAYRVDFAYRVAARTANFLQVKLNAEEGPLGTRDYHIVFEAVPAEAGRTFIRLSYSYSYGLMGRLAMQAYLGTTGRDKVGFTVVGKDADGQPNYIGGMRGVVERNTMRYYLAVEAFLGALSVLPSARVEKSLGAWIASVEGYPRQLHEMERGEYLDMKRREYSRQQAGALTTKAPVAGDGG